MFQAHPFYYCLRDILGALKRVVTLKLYKLLASSVFRTSMVRVCFREFGEGHRG